MRYTKQINEFLIQAWNFKKVRSKVGSFTLTNWSIESHPERTAINRARFIRIIRILL